MQTTFDNGSKPGWKLDRSKDPICYKCYESGHYSNDCRSSIGDFAKIAGNFQGLSAYNRTRVPSKNYKIACRLADPKTLESSIFSSVEEESESKKLVRGIVEPILGLSKSILQRPKKQSSTSPHYSFDDDSSPKIGGLQRPWNRIKRRDEPETIFVMAKRNYKIHADIGRTW